MNDYTYEVTYKDYTERFDNDYAAIDFLVENACTEESFEEYLNEETIDVLGMSYFASDVLKSIDPVRYDCEFFDWRNSVFVDLRDELYNSEEVTYKDYTIKKCIA